MFLKKYQRHNDSLDDDPDDGLEQDIEDGEDVADDLVSDYLDNEWE